VRTLIGRVFDYGECHYVALNCGDVPVCIGLCGLVAALLPTTH
jgi:hypothetical protein